MSFEKKDEGTFNQLDERAQSLIGEGGIFKNPLETITYDNDDAGFWGSGTDEESEPEPEVKPLLAGNEYLAVEEIKSQVWERRLAALSYCHVFMFIPAFFRNKSAYINYHMTQSISILLDMLTYLVKFFIVAAVSFPLGKLIGRAVGALMGLPSLAVMISNFYALIWVIMIGGLLFLAFVKYVTGCIKCAVEALEGILFHHEKISFIYFW